ncbi:amidase signature enzyme [Byssothecium circinans]|uniref:Amidase signature enzyme n=1 Tax=Byssothecium circinans TaxID=147558 RepID=A0A6A5TTC6_9PLEO|nr:amidase signature enzyme [Byssothecium circinans]
MMESVKEICSGSGSLLEVNGINYLVPRACGVDVGGTEDCLVTVFRVPDSDTKVTATWVEAKLREYRKADDTFHDKFLIGVVFSGPANIHIADDAREALQRLGNQWIRTITSDDMLPGPYACVAGRLREVWKLMDDFSGICMAAVRPQNYDFRPSFETLNLTSSDNQFVSIALPSRIHTRARIESPVAGWRILIKDNIDLAGIKTSLGNRAYYDTYPPRAQTAESVQRMIERGVSVVGKTKMNSFGNWEETTEYIDYQAPWNPRADGYQSTGGSSSGSAAAIASYEWLDIAIGTDTWGSITRPALWCGCFGLRPSIGSVATKGIEPYVPLFDMPGILSRDLAKLQTFASEWVNDDTLVRDTKPFSGIIWAADLWDNVDNEQIDLARAFVKDAEARLGLKGEDVSFIEEWGRSPPSKAQGRSMADFIDTVGVALAYDAYHNEDDFRAHYKDKFGRPPYTSPRNQKVWEMASTVSKEERDDGFARIAAYAEWLKDTVLTGNRSNALIIHPQENMRPRYRDQPPTFQRPPQKGISCLALPAVLKGPALAVPIAQIPYHSSVTERVEYLPFVITLVSPQGTDLLLLKTAQEILEGANRPTTVNTGRKMWGMEDVEKSKS